MIYDNNISHTSDHIVIKVELNHTYANESNSDMMQVYGSRFIPYTILFVACFTFNIVSLAAMLNIPGHRTVHHTLLLNLAVCDVFGSVLLWMYYNSPLFFPNFKILTLKHCLFIAMVLVAPVILSLCNSGLALLLLSMNQCIAICHPLFSATKITRRTACFGILIAWILSASFAIIPAFLMLFMARFENCAGYAVEMGVKSLEICTYSMAGLIIIVIGLYGKIYREVVLYRQRTPRQGRRNRTDSEAEHNYKAFITTVLLCSTLVIFWLPYMIFHFISVHLDINNLSDHVVYSKFYVIDFLPMLNFLSDPLIYGMRMREIRSGYHKFFHKVFPCCVGELRRPIPRASVRFTTLDSTTTM